MTAVDDRHRPQRTRSSSPAGSTSCSPAYPPASPTEREFLGAQFDAGLAWVHFPEGYGGLGLSRKLQPLITDRLRQAGAPILGGRNAIGYGMAAPTILTHGLRGAEAALPAAAVHRRGDLVPAVLRARRRLRRGQPGHPGGADGDEWVVNGQKVWTTLAHISRFGMLAGPHRPRRREAQGLTYFVVDMHAPGVEVRPLRQMTGDAEFNEVYFTDVRIPDPSGSARSARAGGAPSPP